MGSGACRQSEIEPLATVNHASRLGFKASKTKTSYTEIEDDLTKVRKGTSLTADKKITKLNQLS